MWELSNRADSVTLTIPGAVKGLSGSDTLIGSSGADVIYGNQNLDLLYGGSGNDTIYGGQNDGPPGPDGVLRRGADTIFGNGGDDVIYGNHGGDIIYTEQADTLEYPSGGSNTVHGGQDADTIYSGSPNYYGTVGQDVIYGDLGDDLLIDLHNSIAYATTSSGVDVFYGGAGADTISSGGGSQAGSTFFGDSLFGGEGADLFELANPQDFPSQSRVAFYEDVIGDFDFESGDRIKLTNLSLSGAELLSLATEIEEGVYRIAFDRTATSYSAQGSIIIRTVPGSGDLSADWFLPSDGRGGPAEPVVELTDDDDSHRLAAAGVVKGLLGSDTLTGSDQADIIYGNQNLDLLDGGLGNDTLYGGQNDGPAGTDGVLRQGADTISGNAGDDVIYGNHGGDIIYTGSGANTAYGGQDADTIYSGTADFNGGSGYDLLYGGLGDDLLIDLFNRSGLALSISGVDVFYGGAGADTIVSGGGAPAADGYTGDTLVGGDGADLFELANKNDRRVSNRVTFYEDVIADFDFVAGDRIKLTNLSLSGEQLVGLATEIEAIETGAPETEGNAYRIVFDPMSPDHYAAGAIIIRTAPGSEALSAAWFV